MHLSVVVPIYNEDKILKKNLIKIHLFFQNKFNFELIVVNDSNNFKITNILNKIKLENLTILNNKKNYGKGYSLIRGIKSSSGDIVLITDIDLSTPLVEYNHLVELLRKDVDIVIGSRSVSSSNIKNKQGIIRIIMGKLYNRLVRFILNINYKDTQCGFKVFKGNEIRKIISKCFINRFSIDVEILYLAKKLNLKVFEKGVIWSNSSSSTVNLLYDPLIMFIDILKIRLKKY
tara:strand:- start:28 stop:723 length:696 start_codon:yes stop_codon:yes gene_type:complete